MYTITKNSIRTHESENNIVQIMEAHSRTNAHTHNKVALIVVSPFPHRTHINSLTVWQGTTTCLAWVCRHNDNLIAFSTMHSHAILGRKGVRSMCMHRLLACQVSISIHQRVNAHALYLYSNSGLNAWVHIHTQTERTMCTCVHKRDRSWTCKHVHCRAKPFVPSPRPTLYNCRFVRGTRCVG